MYFLEGMGGEGLGGGDGGVSTNGTPNTGNEGDIVTPRQRCTPKGASVQWRLKENREENGLNLCK